MSGSFLDREKAATVFHEMLEQRVENSSFGPSSETRQAILQDCRNPEDLLVAIKTARFDNPQTTAELIALAYQFLHLEEAINLKTRFFNDGYPEVMERFELAIAQAQAKYGLKTSDAEQSFGSHLRSVIMGEVPVSELLYRRKASIALFEKLYLVGKGAYRKGVAGMDSAQVGEFVRSLMERRFDDSRFGVDFWMGILDDLHAYTFIVPNFLTESMKSLHKQLFGAGCKYPIVKGDCNITESRWNSRRKYHRRVYVAGYHPAAGDASHTQQRTQFELLIERMDQHQVGLAMSYAAHKGCPLPENEFEMRRSMLGAVKDTKSLSELRGLLFSATKELYMSKLALV